MSEWERAKWALWRRKGLRLIRERLNEIKKEERSQRPFRLAIARLVAKLARALRSLLPKFRSTSLAATHEQTSGNIEVDEVIDDFNYGVEWRPFFESFWHALWEAKYQDQAKEIKRLVSFGRVADPAYRRKSQALSEKETLLQLRSLVKTFMGDLGDLPPPRVDEEGAQPSEVDAPARAETDTADAETRPEVSMAKGEETEAVGGVELSGQPEATPGTATSQTGKVQPPCSPEEYAELLAIKKDIDPDNTYIGTSLVILRVFEDIKRCNQMSDKPVLLVGPTGVGKTAITKLIHSSSDRKDEEFLPVQATDVMAHDEAWAKKRWLGYGKNATFENANPNGEFGYLQMVKGGSIFIDEVAELPDWFQTFLLRVLDPNAVFHVSHGEAEPFIADVRLIMATNDIEKIADKTEFRHDLLDRIERRKIVIPPLCDRRDDVFEFVKYKIGERRVELSFLLALLQHPWSKGNVRELLDVIDIATVNAGNSSSPLTVDLLEGTEVDGAVPQDKKDAQREIYKHLRATLESQGFELGKGLHGRMATILRCSNSQITAMSQL